MKNYRTIFLLMLVLAGSKGNAQSDLDNLNKYWSYRDRFVKNFLHAGSGEGESLPISSRRIGFPSGSIETFDQTASSFYWQDGTIYLGHYMQVLATEYRLLSDANENCDQTLNEIYYCLMTLNRLDLKSENYLSQDQNSQGSEDLNGFFLRDDVSYDAGQELSGFCEDDYSVVFNRECNFQRSNSDFFSAADWWNSETDIEYNGANGTSLDQLITILSGLLFIDELVDPVVVQPTENDPPLNLIDETEAITQRIIHYLNEHEWRYHRVNGQEGCENNQADNQGWICSGNNCRFFSYPIAEIASRILELPATEMGNEFIDHIQDVAEEDVCNGLDGITNLPPFISQWQSEHCNDGNAESLEVEVNISQYSKLWEYMELYQIQYTSSWADIGNYSVGVDANLCVPQFTIFPPSVEIQCSDLFNIEIPLTALAKPFDDDNIHMVYEAATCSNIWNGFYVNNLSQESGLFHMPLMHAVLNNQRNPYSFQSKSSFKTEYIDTSPCGGPYAHPYDLQSNSGPIWASNNKLFHFNNMEEGPINGNGDPESPFRGEFSGIDWMLYYNLYHLLWADELPDYKRKPSCECVVEVIESATETGLIEVERKFPDYKAKGIPIESFLAHSLEVSTTTGILDVKNDLIICRSNPDIPTVLTIKDGAKLNIYEGNTLTVRAGNKIIIEDGGELVGGIPYDECCNGDATLILEENAELHVLNAQFTNYYGLKFELKPGAKFIVDDGVVMYTSQCEGSTIHCHGGQWLMTNSTLAKELNGEVIPMNLDFGSTITFTYCDVFPLNTQFNISENTTLTLDHCEGIIAHGGISLDHNSIIDLQYTDLTLNSSDLTFDYGSTLFQYESTLNCINNSAVEFGLVFPDWQEPCHYYYTSGVVTLDGDGTNIKFDNAQLHIPANTTFQPIHPNGPSGYIEFRGADDHELFTGTNSVFKIVGDGPNDVMLKMNGYADLWNANFGMGTIILQNCKVDLTDHGRLWTDMKFQATNVTFEDLFNSGNNEGGNVQVWHSNVCGFANCHFIGTRLYSFNSKTTINTCDFNGYRSGYSANQNGFIVNNSIFLNCPLESYGLAYMSTVNQCWFENYNNAFIRDESPAELRVLKSTFRDGANGVIKEAGKLTLKCNLFEELDHAAVTCVLGNLNMSSTSGAGYNNFNLVGTCIEADGSYLLDLFKGFNNLSGFTDKCINGYMNMNCPGGQCDLSIDAKNNYWGSAQNTFPPSPNPVGPINPFMWPEIELKTVPGGTNCNFTNGSGGYCDIYIEDLEISVPTGCGTGLPIVRPVRNLGVTALNNTWKGYEPTQTNEQFGLKDLEVDPGNPVLNTSTFEGYTLDSALVYAALQMEIFDSLGNDAAAIALFHEILTSPLDRTSKDIRWRMEWGRYNMKSAMENMFMQDELTPANNTETFEIPVSQYVDVLNTMTDTILTDSTYKEQFYMEIDKGHLFRTLGNPLMARHIYMHLDDCQLDSLEQSILNNWRQEVDLELSLLDQYVSNGISPDSISFDVDTTSYTPAIPYSTSNYYFGVWIDSPTSATFVNCGDNPEYRILRNTQNSLKVYPNPSSGLVTFQIEQEGLYDLTILDISGKQIHTRQINFVAGGTAQMDLSGILSTGNYMIVIENEFGIKLSKLTITD